MLYAAQSSASYKTNSTKNIATMGKNICDSRHNTSTRNVKNYELDVCSLLSCCDQKTICSDLSTVVVFLQNRDVCQC